MDNKPIIIASNEKTKGKTGKSIWLDQVYPPTTEIIAAMKKEGADIPETAAIKEILSKNFPLFTALITPKVIPKKVAINIADKAKTKVSGSFSLIICATLLLF